MEISKAFNLRFELGEGPFWHCLDKKLYCVDVRAKRIYMIDPIEATYYYWQFDNYVGCAIPSHDGGLIVGSGDKVFHFDPKKNEKKILFDAATGMRMNDGKCDQKGRLWVGEADDTGQYKGQHFRLSPDGEAHSVDQGFFISNGLDWTSDYKTFYLSDSAAQLIYKYDYDMRSGEISNKQIFVDLRGQPGYPDGLTLDADDYIWSAEWDGHRIVRYAPDGTVDRVIEMPVQRPTSCMFGGANLDVLYVTSCSMNIGDTEPLAEPNGYIYKITGLGVVGRPQNLFG